MSTDRSAVASRLVCTADRLFDGEAVREGWGVIVDGDTIAQVAPLASIDPSLPRVAPPGCTLLPGLIDTHMHFMAWEGPGFLAYGVTTVRDVGNPLEWILARRAEWKRHLWPRILCQGPLLDGAKPIHPFIGRPCPDLATARTAVREVAEAGVDGIKFYASLNPDFLPAMVEESHAHGLKTSMHCSRGVLEAGRAGVDEFFHHDGILADVWPNHPPGWLSVWGEPGFAKTIDRQKDVADEIRRLGMTSTPTLAYWDSQWRSRQSPTEDFPDPRFVPANMVKWQGQPADVANRDQWRRGLEAAQRFTGLLLERGVPITAGTDIPCGALQPGLSQWREMALLVGSGMTPLQALKASTSWAAAYLEEPTLGCLKPGAVADMVFVRGNPAELIPHAPEVTDVVRMGELHHAADLLSAAAADSKLPLDDPWAAQFEAHWKKWSAPGKQP